MGEEEAADAGADDDYGVGGWRGHGWEGRGGEGDVCVWVMREEWMEVGLTQGRRGCVSRVPSLGFAWGVIGERGFYGMYALW